MSSGKAVVCTTLKNTMLDWEEVEAHPQAEHQARDELTLCEVEAFEAYWAQYVGDDSTPHDLDDIDGFFDGFNFEDERMHMRCQMFRVAEIEQAIKADVAKISYSIMIGGLKVMGRKAAGIIEQCNEYITSLPEVLANIDAMAKEARTVSWGSTEIVEYTPYAWLEPRTIKAPTCNLDLEWLGALAREIATTTPVVLQYLDAKAKAQAKPKPQPEPEWLQKKGTTPFDNFWKFPCRFEGKEPTCKWKDPAKQQK
jgi:hypothetical protein